MAIKMIVALRMVESTRDEQDRYQDVKLIRCKYNDETQDGEGSREHAIKEIESDTFFQNDDPKNWFIVDGERLLPFSTNSISR